MNTINTWLAQFVLSWENQDVEGVLSLFDDNVEYWETPFLHIKNVQHLKSEWESIKRQQDIEINCDVFLKEKNQYTVIWNLTFSDEFKQKKHWKGVYLIRLNVKGKCVYFFQCGESEN